MPRCISKPPSPTGSHRYLPRRWAKPKRWPTKAVSGVPLEGRRVAARRPAVAAVVPAGAGVLITAHRPEAEAMLDAVEALIRVPLP